MYLIGYLMILVGLICGITHFICCYRMESRGYSTDWLICLFRGHDWNLDDPNLDVCQRCGRVEKAISLADI